MQDNSIEAVVARLEKDLIAMKTTQPTGSSSVRAYESLTNYVWDYDYTMAARDNIGFAYSHGFRVIFTSNNQSAPFATIRVIAQVNGVKYNPLSATNLNGGVTTGVDNSYIVISEDIFTSGNLKDSAQDNTVKWVFNTWSKLAGTNFKIKVIVTATDTGRIELIQNQTFA